MTTRRRFAKLFIIAVAAVALLTLLWERLSLRLLEWLCIHPFVVPAIKLFTVLIPSVLVAVFVSTSLMITHEEAQKYAPARNAREEQTTPHRNDGIQPINWHLVDQGSEVAAPGMSEERYGVNHSDFFRFIMWLPNTSEPKAGSCVTQTECSAASYYGSGPGQRVP